MKAEKKKNPHYVNNKEFSQAVVDYVRSVKDAEESGDPAPQVTNYIADCFLKICEGLSYKANFIGYTFREEMVMDAVENCLKAIGNYNIETATRTGNPNAFSYFTQISWYAFLRRISKEKKQQQIKLKYIVESGIEEFMVDESEDPEVAKAIQSYVEQLRRKIDDSKEKDKKAIEPIEEIEKETKSRHRPRVDSDLTEFMEEDLDA